MGVIENTPLVTIAIPTYCRPQLLRRVLECVAKQTYPSLEVYVVDNATPGPETEAVVREFMEKIPGLGWERHPENIGALKNLGYCLRKAHGEFFMWLADDDEITPTYVESCVATLLKQHDAVSVSPDWMNMQDPLNGTRVRAVSYTNSCWFLKALKFSLESSSDHWFYGVHRTSVLKQSFGAVPREFRYWWPNETVVLDTAYPLLLGMIMKGNIIPPAGEEALWINHDYTAKMSDRGASGRGFLWNQIDKLRAAIRRVNLYAIYTEQIYRRGGGLAAAAFIPLAIARLLYELVVALSNMVIARTKKLLLPIKEG